MFRFTQRVLPMALCWLAVQFAAERLRADTWVATPKQCPHKRLAPELYVVQQSDAEFVGVTSCGRAVFCGHEKCLHRVRSLSATVESEIPEIPPKGKRLLISYQSAAGVPSDETLAKAGLRKIEDYQHGSFVIVEPAATVTAAAVNILMDDAAVIHVAPDYVMSVGQHEPADAARPLAATPPPSDPAYPDLWGLQNIQAPQAWRTIRETPKIIVAVIDTGVDYNHPDLKANIWTKSSRHGYDFYDDDDDPMDEQDHGTHCAGTIAGVGNNGVGVVGVSWTTQIMAMRFMGPDGSGSTSDAVKCIDWAVANGAHILSNSWGGPGSSQELVEAVTRAERKGVLFIAAAGNTASVGNNNDTNPNYPASLPQSNVITVGAIDVNNARASFSHYGPRSVDIGAPGVGIVSTVRNNKYARLDGTSMATPHVAGAAALVWGKSFASPLQSPQQMATVRDSILTHARSVPALRNFWGQSAPARVPGGVLDVSFLSQDEPVENPNPPQPQPQPPPPTPGQPGSPTPLITTASARFKAGEITTAKSVVLASAKLSLPEPSTVSIVANTSARNLGAAARVATGFSDKPSLDQYWKSSIRNPEFNASRGWSNVGSEENLQLPAGEHTLYWKVWMEPGASLTFHSGQMLIQATPISKTSNIVAERTILLLEQRRTSHVQQTSHELR